SVLLFVTLSVLSRPASSRLAATTLSDPYGFKLHPCAPPRPRARNVASGVHLGRPPVRTPRPLPRSVAVQATRVARPVHVLNEQRLTAQWGERLPGPRPSKLSPSEGSSESAETPQESSTARRAIDKRDGRCPTGIACPDPE
ncbi:uncharacterized protein C8Q71DRAFT_908746, partial [Rhodofomes roseus]